MENKFLSNGSQTSETLKTTRKKFTGPNGFLFQFFSILLPTYETRFATTRDTTNK